MKNKLKFLNDHIMQFIYEDVSTCIKEGKEEDAAKMVENIVQQGAYDPKEIYRPLLCWAAFRGDTKTAEFCKNQEADLDFEDHLGRTPLWVAKSSGQRQMVEALESWGHVMMFIVFTVRLLPVQSVPLPVVQKDLLQAVRNWK